MFTPARALIADGMTIEQIRVISGCEIDPAGAYLIWPAEYVQGGFPERIPIYRVCDGSVLPGVIVFVDAEMQRAMTLTAKPYPGV